ncbi:hypothetical protein FKW77_009861 [Venturia effusa]|uniref:Mannan endo-1,6-alpha-mannosidase n=1 Tax=Venturia effusa TaxID=50376 RepID=A0A517LEQ3_9PEZI|nr:hypothetical protein FKW77_009861 [Venturia effusa]
MSIHHKPPLCGLSSSFTRTSLDSIRSAASTAAWGMVKYYTGNNTGDVPGNLPSPYYWWEAGAFFNALIDYWYYTGDTTYNTITTAGIQHQVGADVNFMPANQSKSLGNDDQGFWGMTAMTAAEYNFPNPDSSLPQWLALAQAVFNTQVPRWDDTTCGGGLRWQIFTFNSGYDYKNSISNGAFFNLAARLGRYTGNQTYLDWAEKSWDWISTVGLMDGYRIYDGSDDTLNCTQVDHIQWTYNAGIYLYGAAMMWNVSAANAASNASAEATAATTKWQTRINGILNTTSVFFPDNNNIMSEVACEANGKCDTDQRSFKAHFSRWLAATAKVAPFTKATILELLTASATAAAKTCTAGTDSNQCGLQWTTGTNDGSMGVGEQMSALEVFQGLLVDSISGPVTNTTGGTSVGNNAAGSGTDDSATKYDTIDGGDKAGAAILTLVVLLALFAGAGWIVMSD